ncbi:MAG TPA: glycosyltransferase [Acidimicrobiales bacterium]|nr:glycosyltransferase [Acidimicrobiales bacterium]
MASTPIVPAAPGAGTSFLVSIVIPLYNKVEYTEACLTSLAATTPPDLFEVVLVDNGSTDGTGELLACLGGDVQVIRNAENLGFSKACNQGAAVARGRHLLFLNNDTEPHPGWLDPILAILEGEPDVGVVGSKLLFPDGTVQHAGVWMVADHEAGTLDGYHRLYRAVPDDPRVDRRTDLQVVTGACLAIRRPLFEAVGGFDEEYWNGNEDVDLCLKVRAAGYRVVYEPASRLTHHESVSGPERFSRAEENRVLLRHRWEASVAPDALTDAGAYRATGAGLRHGAGGTAGPTDRLSVHARRPDAVSIVGYLDRGGRPSPAMTMVADLLAAAGIDHDLAAYHRAVTWDTPPALSAGDRPDSGRILVACVAPGDLVSFAVDRGPHFFAHRYVIAVWDQADPSVPDHQALSFAHEFWVPGDGLRSAVASAAAGEALVLGAPPLVGGDAAALRTATGTTGRVAFTATAALVGGDPGTATEAVEAFRTAFAPGEGPALLVGLTGAAHQPWVVDGLLRAGGGHPDITYLDLDDAGVAEAALAAAGDCHICPQGVAGFASPGLSAMASGVPVVAFEDPGNLRVVSPRNTYLLRPTGDASRVEQLAAALRRVAGNPAEAANRGRRAAADALDRHDRGRAVQLVRSRIRRATGLLARIDEARMAPV